MVARVANVERGDVTVRRRAEKEGVACVGARTRRGHLDPPCAVAAPKSMRRAHGYRSAGAGLELHTSPFQVEHGFPFEHVEARLVGVRMLVDMAVDERDQRQRHVRRAERAVDEPAGRKAGGVARQGVRELDVLAPDEAISGAPVRELVCAGLAGHRGTPADPTTAEDATAAAIPSAPSRRPPSSFARRSAPRTYVRPATSSSSAGKRVMTSHRSRSRPPLLRSAPRTDRRSQRSRSRARRPSPLRARPGAPRSGHARSSETRRVRRRCRVRTGDRSRFPRPGSRAPRQSARPPRSCPSSCLAARARSLHRATRGTACRRPAGSG